MRSNCAWIIFGVVFLGIAPQSGCTFDSSTRSSQASGADAGGAEQGSDGSTASPDAGCAFANATLCTEAEEGGVDSSWDVTSDVEFDTDIDSRCRTFSLVSGAEACLVLVASFSLEENVFFRVVGSRPFILASPTSIELRGSLDLSSSRDERPGAGANAGNGGLGSSLNNGDATTGLAASGGGGGLASPSVTLLD